MLGDDCFSADGDGQLRRDHHGHDERLADADHAGHLGGDLALQRRQRNESTQTQHIVVADLTAPVPDAASLADATGECSATIASAPTATDNCGATITGTTSDSLTRTTQGTSVVTWHFSDGNGNESTQTQHIVVADLTAPVPDAASLADATGECSATIASAKQIGR